MIAGATEMEMTEQEAADLFDVLDVDNDGVSSTTRSLQLAYHDQICASLELLFG